MEAIAAAKRASSAASWRSIARPEQIAPEGDWFVWLIRSGRGWGKTRTGGEWVLDRVRQGFKRIALVGQTKADVRDTMIELGESSIMNIAPPDLRPTYEPSKRRLTWENGAIAIVYSGDEPAQLRGPQHDSVWIDELAKFKYPQETWDNVKFGLRIGSQPQCVITTTPRPLKLLREIIARPSTIDVRRSSYENIANLSPVYKAEVLDPVSGTRLGRQEIEGDILEDAPGALWNRETMIDAYRVPFAPEELTRIVVAIDPATTSSDTSDEAGIIAVGRNAAGHAFVLADNTMRARPAEWAAAGIRVYDTFKANTIAGEGNNGGEMIEDIISLLCQGQKRSKPHYRMVWAAEGKRTRAEPVSAMYEKGLVHHVGTLVDLEDEMCSWEPNEGKSPNRIDALVWAMHELGLVKAYEVKSVPNPFY